MALPVGPGNLGSPSGGEVGQRKPTVLAVGLFAPVAVLNTWLQDRLDLAFGGSAPQLFLQGTLLTMFVAYLARFLAVGTGPVESGLERIHRNLDEAAMLLGARGAERLYAVAARTPLPELEALLAESAPGDRLRQLLDELSRERPDDVAVISVPIEIR